MRKALLAAQRNEITEHHIYTALAARSAGKNRTVLKRIAQDELEHYRFLKGKTGRAVAPSRFRISWFLLMTKLFGVVFTLRVMESGEDAAQAAYARLRGFPGVQEILRDEEEHEHELIGMIQEETLDYAGSIVLGLNDALVELTGALAGLTLALQESRIVAMAGLITGIAASLSMAASGYLSSKEEGSEEKNPVKSAVYTGVAYIITVLLLVAPYLLLANIYAALAVTLSLAVLIIAGYTFYITTAKRLGFWPRFLEMAAISLGVAVISFGVGWLLRGLFGIEA